MRTISIYHRIITLLFICLPVMSLAQGKIDTHKKSKTEWNGSSHKTILLNASKPSDDTKLPAAAFQGNPQKKTPICDTTRSRVLMPNNFIKKLILSESNLPIFVETLPEPAHAVKSTARQPSVECFNYLNKLKPLLKMEHPEDHFVIAKSSTDMSGKTHIRLNQVYKGIPVHGGEVIVHLSKDGEGELFNGRFYPVTSDINTSPAISPALAVENAASHANNGNTRGIKEPLFDFLASQEKPVSSLILYRKKNTDT